MEHAILDTQQDNMENVSLFIMELQQEEDEDDDDAPLFNKSSYLYYTSLENEALFLQSIFCMFLLHRSKKPSIFDGSLMTTMISFLALQC
eukprot:15355653-Ditylum_brightwellii.AAC.1